MPQNVLLLAPPNPFLSEPYFTPKMGLLYLGTILKENGHNVTLRHLASLADMEALLKANDYDFIGISATTREYPDAIQMLNYIKRIGSNAIVAIGGPHATAMSNECKTNGFDVVAVGETDYEILSIVSRLWGAVYTAIISIPDLDILPSPDRSLLVEDFRPFLYTGQSDGMRVTTMLLSRGCPYRCAFCGPHGPYRRRSQANIAGELAMLKESGYDGIVIMDDLPFATEQHVDEFCEVIRPLNMSFRCNLRPDMVTDKIAFLLLQAGCKQVQLGIESASDRVLDMVGKGMNPETNGEAVRMLQGYLINVKALFMWGLPGDGPETAEAIVKWVEQYKPDSVQITTFVPLPGSPLWESNCRRVTDYNALNFYDNDGENVCGIGNDRLSTEELSAMKREILNQIIGD